MKILLVHNEYKIKGGEEGVLAQESALLKDHGHTVIIYSESNESINGWKRIKVALQTPYSVDARERIASTIKHIHPDIVHVHNFFPLLTPSIYDACIHAGIPVVQTLHNYRMICPGALLMCNGLICEQCLTSSPYRSVLKRCYRNSLIGTLMVACMVDLHRRLGTWHKKVDRFVAHTEFSKNKFVEGGLPSEKIEVKPNFVNSPPEPLPKKSTAKKDTDPQSLFIGRISQEKGITTLLRSWQNQDIPLRIAGDGPLLEQIKQGESGFVKALGRLSRVEIEEELIHTDFLIMPSECYETFGLVLTEAYSYGVPVVASNLGAMAEIVEDGVTGLLFEAGNAADLKTKVDWMKSYPSERIRMGNNARRVFEEKYTPERNYEKLISIYQDVLKG
jgi:glycosyltransferase involved in cell wall biosynthesis